MRPLVSVCIPAYNNAAYIKETIDSVLNQTYSNLELIICDDKSKDDTVQVIESIHDDRMKLYKNEKNLGMSGNWNHCLSKCRGEFIKLICADDILAKNCLEKDCLNFSRPDNRLRSAVNTIRLHCSSARDGSAIANAVPLCPSIDHVRIFLDVISIISMPP